MNKKYKLRTDLTKVVDGVTLYAVEALISFGNVEAGSVGGYVQNETNLSQSGDAWVYGNAWVSGNARVSGDAWVYGNAWVSGNARVYGDAEVYGDARVSGDAQVSGDAWVSGNARVSGNAWVSDDARVSGNAQVYGDAQVKCNFDFYVSKNIWSSGRYFTYTHSNKMWAVGCFYGTGEELVAKAYKDSEVSGREYKRIVDYVEAMYADLENDKKDKEKWTE